MINTVEVTIKSSNRKYAQKRRKSAKTQKRRTFSAALKVCEADLELLWHLFAFISWLYHFKHEFAAPHTHRWLYIG